MVLMGCIPSEDRWVKCPLAARQNPLYPCLARDMFTSEFMFLDPSVFCDGISSHSVVFQLTHQFIHFDFFFFSHVPKLDLAYPFSERLLKFLAVGRRIK